jgi:hypothetical protein
MPADTTPAAVEVEAEHVRDLEQHRIHALACAERLGLAVEVVRQRQEADTAGPRRGDVVRDGPSA